MGKLIKWILIIAALWFLYNQYREYQLNKQDEEEIPFTDPVFDRIFSENTFPGTIVWQSVTKEGKPVVLEVGNEKYGLKHILCRHFADYCINFKPKGSLFNPKTNSNQLFQGLEFTVKNGKEVDKKSNNNNIRLDARTSINGLNADYVLVFNKSGRIITFYPRL